MLRPLDHYQIGAAKAASLVGKRTAFFCPESHANFYREVFRDSPLVEVNPTWEVRPLPVASCVIFEEAAALTEEQWRFIENIPARRRASSAPYRAALEPTFEDCLCETEE